MTATGNDLSLQLFGDGDDVFAGRKHEQWLAQHRNSLLDFYQPNVRLDGGGYAYLDGMGGQLRDQGSQLWLGARMLHCFAVAHLLGRNGAAEIVEHGLDFYGEGPGRDEKFGGWFATVGGGSPDDRKELYGQAHILLASASAVTAGFARAGNLLDEALDLIDRHYWIEADGRCSEAYDREFRLADPYRGQNSNMHLTEAYLAAYEVTRDDVLLERAVRISTHIASRAADMREGAWRLPEHFDPGWEPLPDFNRDDPRHPFRPYGSQPGHWLEWSKLLLHMRNLGVDESWILPAAVNLFQGAFTDGWMDNGGFVYTVDWDGTPVVRERFFWEPAEGISAARYLYAATGDQRYDEAYRRIWRYVVERVVDHEHGSWHPELDDDNQPVTHTWPGKADLYHAFQATLPADRSFAPWALDQAQP